jgi:hypothetical protein
MERKEVSEVSESKAKMNKLRTIAQQLYTQNMHLRGELRGLVQTLWLLTQQNGGSIHMTHEEMKAVPANARLRVFEAPETPERKAGFVLEAYLDAEATTEDVPDAAVTQDGELEGGEA